MKKFYLLSSAFILFFSINVYAEDYIISIKNHQFSPAQITIPANQKIKLIIKNLDSTIIEFESQDLNREKIVAGNSEGIIFLGPLKAGEYKYFDDFRSKTSKGSIIVK